MTSLSFRYSSSSDAPDSQTRKLWNSFENCTKRDRARAHLELPSVCRNLMLHWDRINTSSMQFRIKKSTSKSLLETIKLNGNYSSYSVQSEICILELGTIYLPLLQHIRYGISLRKTRVYIWITEEMTHKLLYFALNQALRAFFSPLKLVRAFLGYPVYWL